MYIYFNGDFLSDQSSLNITTELAFLRGIAIFDFFGIQRGIPLFIEDYLDRFYNSAQLIGLSVPMARQFLKAEISKLIARNNLENGYCKILLTGGYSQDGFRLERENIYMIPQKAIHYSDNVYIEGVKLILDNFKRELPRVKTTNYLNAFLKLKEMNDAGAVEVLYHDNGQIRECSRCNFFIIKRGKLITQSSDILEGITRKQLINKAKESYEVEVRPLDLEEIYSADEAFITSTTKILFPVIEIDGDHVNDGKVGPVTKDLLNKMKKHIASHVEEQLKTV